MASLLEKTRKINRLLQRSENVEYDGISRKRATAIDVIVLIAINGALGGIEPHSTSSNGCHEFNLSFLGNVDAVPVLDVGDVIRCAVA